MRFVIATLLWVLTSGLAFAHELTPTYPKLRQSIYDNVLVTNVTMFNRREDVNYYSIEVWDENWESVPFATSSKVIQLNYLERKNVELFFRISDRPRVTYICTRSKILETNETSVIASNICSKVK